MLKSENVSLPESEIYFKLWKSHFIPGHVRTDISVPFSVMTFYGTFFSFDMYQNIRVYIAERL